jgi:hypothetical protein
VTIDDVIMLVDQVRRDLQSARCMSAELDRFLDESSARLESLVARYLIVRPASGSAAPAP